MTASKKTTDVPDFQLLEGVVDPRILDAARAASKAMDAAGIRHALIGALAVGAYGYVRATKDVDFLVDEGAFVHHGGGIVTHKPGVPIEVNGVHVDVLTDAVVEADLDEPFVTRGVPIVAPEALIYLKLKAHRRRDKEDVIELLRAGLDEQRVRDFLEEVAPELLDLFLELAERADEEE
jgi:hypothetical protein